MLLRDRRTAGITSLSGKSAERKVINGYLYLSKAYADLYRFDEAIENLDEHIYWLERKIVMLLKWKA